VKRARSEIEQHWRKRYEEKGVPYPEKGAPVPGRVTPGRGLGANNVAAPVEEELSNSSGSSTTH
jgi:hypothetical protein